MKDENIKVQIQLITKNEITTLELTSIKTFLDTFTDNNSNCDLDEYLNNTYDIKKLNQKIANPKSDF